MTKGEATGIAILGGLVGIFIGLILGIAAGTQGGKIQYMKMQCDQFTKWQYDQGLELAKCK